MKLKTGGHTGCDKATKNIGAEWRGFEEYPGQRD